MRAGRKTATYDMGSKAAVHDNKEEAKRNLGEVGKLGGVIFGCTKDTMGECLNGLIFGLPRAHFSYVYHIEPGLPIFLFNYNDRYLHGIFRATSYGQLEVNPHAWTGGNTLKTRFPAQVEVEVWKECAPIHERDFRPIIKNCYYQQGDRANYFVFELTKAEAKGLITRFEQRESTAGQARSRVQQQAAAPQGRPQSQPAGGARLSPASSAPAPGSWAAKAVATKQADDDDWQTVTSKKGSRGAAAVAVAVAPVATPVSGAWGLRADSGRSTPRSQAQTAPAQNFAADSLAEQEARDLESALAASAAEARRVQGSPRQQQQPQQQPGPTSQPRAQAQPEAQSFTAVPPTNGSSSSRPASRGSVSSPAPSSTNDQSLAVTFSPGSGLLAPAAKLDSRITLNFTPQQRASRLSWLRAERKRLLTLASRTTGMEALELTVQAVLAENEELRQGQMALAGELRNLRQQLGALQAAGGRPPQPGAPQRTSSGVSDTAVRRHVEDMYVVGGNTGAEWLRSVDIFTAPGRWRKGADMPEARGYGALAAIPGSLLYLGGGNGTSWMSSVLRYDLAANSWSHAPDMSTARGSLAAAVLDGKVYALGGGQPSISLETTEIWDPNLDTFMAGKSMHHKRFTTAAGVLGGAIYACGGYDTTRYLDSIERLDPREGLWSFAAPMQHKRGALSVTVLGEQLVALGGWDGKGAVDTVEMYDPRADAWRALKSLTPARAYCAAATISGRIVVVGGMRGETHVESMQLLDVAADMWVPLDIPATVPACRSFLAACAV